MRRRWLVAVLVPVLIPIAVASPRASGATCAAPTEISLWNSGTVLRGANVYQGRNVFNADVPFGDGPFTQSDFDDLKAAGANYVHISHAGLFTEDPPYVLDQSAVDNLDKVLDLARNAGLYAGIAFRSGPGRNDLSIVEADSASAKHTIWTSQAAQDAWVEQVKYAANRYKNDPIVVGLSVMVEPTAYSQHTNRFGFIGPEEFYAQFGGTIEDVNGLYARATTAIRSVDQKTPILLEPEGHGNIDWLPHVRITGDPATVYTVHDYSPFKFTHFGKGRYPSRKNNRDAQLELLRRVDEFGRANGVPVAFTEFGVRRFARGAAKYIRDRIELIEGVGNWFIWTWQPAGFKDPFSVHNPGKIQDVVKTFWANNCTRP
jgi:aryl-phospho-beta-D-glucosidase BglC (GH1 family)